MTIYRGKSKLKIEGITKEASRSKQHTQEVNRHERLYNFKDKERVSLDPKGPSHTLIQIRLSSEVPQRYPVVFLS